MMVTKVIQIVALCLALVQLINCDGKVVCYYDSASFLREGLGKVSINDLEPALSFCTHLVYGYAGINADTNKLKSLNDGLDLDQGKGHYRIVTQLKRKYPNLKVLLSVGGERDIGSDDNNERVKYLTLLESSGARIAFINSAYTILKTYEFDGLDLAWQFPLVKPKKVRSSLGSFWHKVKKIVGATGGPVDEKEEEHREEYSALLRELKNSFRHDGYQLSVTVLPNVNASIYFDVPAIVNYIDFVNVAAYDLQTPLRNPKEADFPGPLYKLSERAVDSNVDSQVGYWLKNGTPANKVVVGIPTYGRAWKMTSDSGLTGVPPLTVEGPAPEGIQSKQAGLLSWPEICAKLPNPSNTNLKGEEAPVRKVGDPTKRYGSYGYRLPDKDGEHGIWIGYEDPDTAGNKAGYVKAKGLGGISINDLSYDDFRGACTGDKFPILRAAKYRL